MTTTKNRQAPGWAGISGDADMVRRLLGDLIDDGVRSVLLCGSSGGAHCLLARRIVGLLGKPAGDEATALRLVRESYRARTGNEPPAIDGRPFRAPHHSISAPALYGPHASEYSLATAGVLYCDGVTDFNESALERTLRLVHSGDPLGPRLLVGSVHTPSEPAKDWAYAGDWVKLFHTTVFLSWGKSNDIYLHGCMRGGAEAAQ